MNKFQKFMQRNKATIVSAASTVAVSVAALAAPFAHATLSDDITSIASTVGVTFQSSATTMLVAILPYVVTIAILFLAARLVLRWVKKSAH